jgi:hypothetical protein
MSNGIEEKLQDLAYELADISNVLTLLDYEAAGWVAGGGPLTPEAQMVYKNGLVGIVGVLSHEMKRVSERMSDIAGSV